MSLFWDALGITAAMLTSFSFVPQIIRVYKHRSAKDVSPVTLFQLSLGVLLWIAYGAHLKSAVIIAANFITLLSLAILLFFYFFFRRD